MGLGLLVLLFRQIERWLHQHIFKVGWLLTNDYQTTTILYYILFLPGILLHELALWLAAGLLNVRAERAIQFPEPQEIGELRLNFIRLATETGLIKRLVIAAAPFAAGLIALWAIGAQVFNWQALIGMMPAFPGSLDESGLLAISTLYRGQRISGSGSIPGFHNRQHACYPALADASCRARRKRPS